jgi:hypothetical protein
MAAAGELDPGKPNIPRSIAEAKASPEWPQWEHTINSELENLTTMGTWELEECPTERKPVGCRWVFDLKTGQQGEIVRYKARLVAKGYSQISGIDYFDTFAPVVRLESLRALLAIAAVKDLEMKQLDVKGAYLNGDLQEEVFMEQPPGFDDGSGRKCRLKKTLYGLKQSGREWNRKLHSILTKHGFHRLKVDHGVYLRQIEDQYVVITVWVDDLLLLSNAPTMLSATEAALKRSRLTISGSPRRSSVSRSTETAPRGLSRSRRSTTSRVS